MKTLSAIAHQISLALEASGKRKVDLCHEAGISKQTLYNVLNGVDDYKVTTLLALADRVGLDLLLVPKDATLSSESRVTQEIPTVVTAALQRIKEEGNGS